MHETRFSIFLRAFLEVRLFAYLQKASKNCTTDNYSELHKHFFAATIFQGTTLSIGQEFRCVSYAALTFLHKLIQKNHLTSIVETVERTLFSGEFRVSYKDMKCLAKFAILTNDLPPPSLSFTQVVHKQQNTKNFVKKCRNPTSRQYNVTMYVTYSKRNYKKCSKQSSNVEETFLVSCDLGESSMKLLVYSINGDTGARVRKVTVNKQWSHYCATMIFTYEHEFGE